MSKDNSGNIKTKIVFKRCLLTLFSVLGYLILAPVWGAALRRNNVWRILRYHSVSDDRIHETNVSIDTFRNHMSFLKDNYNIISLNNASTHIAGRNSFKNNCVSVTFDDGYMSTFTGAYPVLKDLNIPATIFLISSYVSTNKILSHDSRDIPESNRMLTWKQINDMDPEIISYGSHTATHYRLSDFDPKLFETEILLSKHTIEKNTGKIVDFISYPFGTIFDFSDKWRKYIINSGYKCGFAAMFGWNTLSSDPYKLRRIGIESSDTIFTIKSKLNGALDPFFAIAETGLGRKIIRAINKFTGTLDYN